MPAQPSGSRPLEQNVVQGSAPPLEARDSGRTAAVSPECTCRRPATALQLLDPL